MMLHQLAGAAGIPLRKPLDHGVVIRMTTIVISSPVLRDCSP